MDNSNLPPVLPPVEVAIPGSMEIPAAPVGKAPEWPVKKKKKWLPVFGGVIALILVAGASFGAYYFTRNLNQTDVPTAPSSEPKAAEGIGTEISEAECDAECATTGKNGSIRNGVCKCVGGLDEGPATGGTGSTTTSCAATPPSGLTVTNISPTSVKLSWTPGTGNYVKLWVSSNPAGNPTADCGRLANKVTDTVCRANENGSLINGDPDHADIPSSTTSYTVTGLTPNTKYYFRMMMWIVSGCDREAPTINFTTQATTCGSDLSCSGSEVTGSTSCTGQSGTLFCCPAGQTIVNGACTTACIPVSTSWTPAANLTCVGTNVTQTNNCGTTQSVAGTKVDTVWTPAVDTKCSGDIFTQTGDCGATRSATGTKATTWTPDPTLTCSDLYVTQTNTCNTTRKVKGTKDCGTPDISMIKKVYQDETSNKAGSYKYSTEIDTASKDQTVVIALEITNGGSATASGITVKDVLKEDNRELLTFVDSDSRCSYAASTRTVTCSSMNLSPNKSDVYAFRVKVSNNAVNGDTILNNALLSYTGMPTGGEVEGEVEILISTVVGCNHVCTTDEECGTGLSCDPDTNKCRKPACADSTNCTCSSTAAAPTRTSTRAATRVAQPTTLPETGILDFPGVAAFGGGLLLAIVGILLAL